MEEDEGYSADAEAGQFSKVARLQKTYARQLRDSMDEMDAEIGTVADRIDHIQRTANRRRGYGIEDETEAEDLDVETLTKDVTLDESNSIDALTALIFARITRAAHHDAHEHLDWVQTQRKLLHALWKLDFGILPSRRTTAERKLETVSSKPSRLEVAARAGVPPST